MLFQKFVDNINLFAKENPNTLKLTVVASNYNEYTLADTVADLINANPSKGYYSMHRFISDDQYSSYDIDINETNAVCIN